MSAHAPPAWALSCLSVSGCACSSAVVSCSSWAIKIIWTALQEFSRVIPQVWPVPRATPLSAPPSFPSPPLCYIGALLVSLTSDPDPSLKSQFHPWLWASNKWVIFLWKIELMALPLFVQGRLLHVWDFGWIGTRSLSLCVFCCDLSENHCNQHRVLVEWLDSCLADTALRVALAKTLISPRAPGITGSLRLSAPSSPRQTW